jgi:hypothetical protein
MRMKKADAILETVRSVFGLSNWDQPGPAPETFVFLQRRRRLFWLAIFVAGLVTLVVVLL